ncbi:hypothetical protein FRC01_007573, partial [Tulasnella sp. 417]
MSEPTHASPRRAEQGGAVPAGSDPENSLSSQEPEQAPLHQTHGQSMKSSTEVSGDLGSRENPNATSATTNSLPLRQLYGQAVNSLTDMYLFAADAAEHTRLNAQHGAIILTFGGLFPSEAQGVVQASLQSPDRRLKPAVLDIGTGSGAWAIDMAKQIPEADVIGCDLVPVNPGSEPPSNCRFELCDVNVNLERYPSNAFNIVHARYVLQGIKDYPSFFKQVARLLRPGGVFVSIEPACAGFDAQKNRITAKNPEDPGFTWFHRLATYYGEATLAGNPSLASVERVGGVLRDLGDTWSAVSDTSAFVPVGAWSTNPVEQRAGGLMGQSMLGASVSTRPLFLSRGISIEDVERLQEGLRTELAESRVQQYMG